MNSSKKPRVIVGMSSGVDSSVAAALLKKQGFDVVGVFMHFWKEAAQGGLAENKCCSVESLEDASRVCQILNIPLYTANEKEFKKEVVDYFLNEYAVGRTPNPCVACNEHIKFNVLMKKMLEMEGDFIASGNYAQKRQIPNPKSQILNKSRIQDNKSKTIYHLFQGKHNEKDQSYFLYNFNQEAIGQDPVSGRRIQKTGNQEDRGKDRSAS